MRNLNLILGDQLDKDSVIFHHFEDSDCFWMAESDGENTQVKHHQLQITMFLSAMRHFAKERQEEGFPFMYLALDSDSQGVSLGQHLAKTLKDKSPERVRVVRPGDRRVLNQLQAACEQAEIPLEVLEDSHFFSTPQDFATHAEGRKSLRLEFFYRELRKRFDYLMDDAGQPLGGQWNYDAENRETFGKDGPPKNLRDPAGFEPDEITNEIIEMVEKRYPDHPGQAREFRLPVTRTQALTLLEDFFNHRLPYFGDFQDAMWEAQFFLYHSRISTAMNIKLLHPEEVCRGAEKAYHDGLAPLNAVEGFIRQILGWREYVRGVYWHFGEEYKEKNFLEAKESLPHFFWEQDTDMTCLADTLKGVHQNAYSHHIQRLMVTGLFCLLYGVEPNEFNDWHIATHADAIDWVSAPNVIGMSQFADGGLLASKPYCASGNYIAKMGNYCKNCRYKPKEALGEKACPFTTFYWDFLDRNQERLAKNNRLKFQFANLRKKSPEFLEEVREKAVALRQSFKAKKH